MVERYLKSMEEIIGHLHRVREEVSLAKVDELARKIMGHPRVFCYGAGRSGFVARCFAQRLMHIGIEAYFLGETLTPSVQSGDIFLVVSGSGRTASSVCLARKAKKVGATVVLITAHKEGPIADIADLVLKVPGKTKLVEKVTYAPFTSLFDIAALSVLDSLASELMGRMGVGEELILSRHANIE